MSAMPQVRTNAIADLEDDLVFDELDDCCRQEIQEYNHKQRVTRELRQFDRVDERNRIRTNIVNSIRSTSCDSCCGGRCDGDYPMLAYTRSLQNARDDGRPGLADDNRGDSGSDSDKDSMDDLLDDDFKTPYELERMQQASALAHKQETAQQYGLAVHCEDSLHHLARYYVSKGYAVVLHVYDPSAAFCARLDLLLERMSSEHTGTLFRRVPLSVPFLQKYLSDWGCDECAPALLFFDSGSLYLRRGFDDLGYPDDFYSSDVCALLVNSRALRSDISSAVLAAASVVSHGPAAFADSDEEAEESSGGGGRSYCSTKGCSRNFPHEHVGGAGASFVSGAAQAGAEALADNIFTKI